jgi:hypothetical protein
MLGIILGTLAVGLLCLLLFWFAAFGPHRQPETYAEGVARQKAEHERLEEFQEWLDWIIWHLWRPSSEDVLEAFREEGLEVGAAYPLQETPQPFPGPGPIPKTYEEATRFEIPSLGRDQWAGKGGRVFIFDSEKDLKVVADYYRGLGVIGKSHLYSDGLVLVQINGELPEGKARQYREALKKSV